MIACNTYKSWLATVVPNLFLTRVVSNKNVSSVTSFLFACFFVQNIPIYFILNTCSYQNKGKPARIIQIYLLFMSALVLYFDHSLHSLRSVDTSPGWHQFPPCPAPVHVSFSSFLFFDFYFLAPPWHKNLKCNPSLFCRHPFGPREVHSGECLTLVRITCCKVIRLKVRTRTKPRSYLQVEGGVTCKGDFSSHRHQRAIKDTPITTIH